MSHGGMSPRGGLTPVDDVELGPEVPDGSRVPSSASASEPKVKEMSSEADADHHADDHADADADDHADERESDSPAPLPARRGLAIEVTREASDAGENATTVRVAVPSYVETIGETLIRVSEALRDDGVSGATCVSQRRLADRDARLQRLAARRRDGQLAQQAGAQNELGLGQERQRLVELFADVLAPAHAGVATAEAERRLGEQIRTTDLASELAGLFEALARGVVAADLGGGAPLGFDDARSPRPGRRHRRPRRRRRR